MTSELLYLRKTVFTASVQNKNFLVSHCAQKIFLCYHNPVEQEEGRKNDMHGKGDRAQKGRENNNNKTKGSLIKKRKKKSQVISEPFPHLSSPDSRTGPVNTSVNRMA